MLLVRQPPPALVLVPYTRSNRKTPRNTRGRIAPYSPHAKAHNLPRLHLNLSTTPPSSLPSHLTLLLPHPLPPNPPPKKLQTRLGLIHRHHMATSMQSHKRQIPTPLNLPDLHPLLHRGGVIARQSEVVERGFLKGRLARPFERFRPAVVAQPVADEVRVALFPSRF